MFTFTCALYDKNETKLDKKYLAYFAFAEEKLDELSELKKLAEDENYKGKNEFIENKELFEADRSCTDENVRKRLENAKDSDYIRLPERTKRQALQRPVSYTHLTLPTILRV